MKVSTYFKKYGCIYGVSSKYAFGHWEHDVYKFDDMDTAREWLNTEEYDFRERELMSKTAAINLAGEKAVENAIDDLKEQWKAMMI